MTTRSIRRANVLPVARDLHARLAINSALPFEAAMEELEAYRKKRDFQRTPEPSGGARRRRGKRAGGAFVIQKHAARRLHYDLRLELDGVFKSWAVPKGPTTKPGEKNLAVHVEDHPLEYGDFEGVIPKGSYGAGTVMIWDRGRWSPAGDADGYEKGKLDFVLEGEKLRGRWTLVRMSGAAGEEGKNWLLIKRRSEDDSDEIRLTDTSVATGRTMQQIARERDRTWTRAGETTSRTTPPLPDPGELNGAVKGRLPEDPRPQLATLADEAPDAGDWVHEIKFDGYRILARLESGKIRLISRNGHDWTRRFPEIAQVASGLPADEALLDGEVVVLAPGGTSSFRALQEALSSGRTEGLVYQMFDLLHLNGYDLKPVPLLERKRALKQLLDGAGLTPESTLRFTDHIEGQGRAFHEQACKLGLEGIVSKRASSLYRSRRTGDWIKVKCTQHEELVVGGYTDPGGARTGFGALLLGAWEGDALSYAGKVGTGFDERQLKSLAAMLRKLEISSSPFSNAPRERGVHWVKPELVAEVEFTEWTREGVLRHPSFRGLREDRSAAEIRLDAIRREPAEPRAAARATSTRKSRPATRARGAASEEAQVAGVRLTNPDRVLYPDEGVTKLELARYYEEIERWILPPLAKRPLALLRCPEGYTKQCFFQKHPGKMMDASIPRVRIREKSATEEYMYLERLSDLVHLVQMGVLELHAWGSTVERLECPDYMVFDLDPGPDVTWRDMLQAARDLRERLEQLGLAAFARTTGGKGLHVVTPLAARDDWEQVKAFAHAISEAHAQDDPRRYTTNMAKSKRRGRIFIDYLRNGRGATAIASYSTRAREGAPVAVPVRWEELNAALTPNRYQVRNLRRRLRVLEADPWEGFGEAAKPISAAMRRTVGMG